MVLEHVPFFLLSSCSFFLVLFFLFAKWVPFFLFPLVFLFLCLLVPYLLCAMSQWGAGGLNVFNKGLLLFASCLPWSSRVPGLLVPLSSSSLLPLCYEIKGGWGVECAPWSSCSFVFLFHTSFVLWAYGGLGVCVLLRDYCSFPLVPRGHLVPFFLVISSYSPGNVFIPSCSPWWSWAHGLLVPLSHCSLVPLCYQLVGGGRAVGC